MRQQCTAASRAHTRGGGGGEEKRKTKDTHQGGGHGHAGALEVDDAGLVGVPDAAADRGDAEQQRELQFWNECVVGVLGV